jgi:putative PIN family toxin of toxin-antitoxin system
MIRIILDTNLWISFLISDRLSKLDDLLDRNELAFLFSPELLEEFIEVAQRPKLRRYFPNHRIEVVLDLFDSFGELIEVQSYVEVCRDPKDNFLLALAKDGKADYLITGDSDLLSIQRFENTEIVTYKEFTEKLGR